MSSEFERAHKMFIALNSAERKTRAWLVRMIHRKDDYPQTDRLIEVLRKNLQFRIEALGGVIRKHGAGHPESSTEMYSSESEHFWGFSGVSSIAQQNMLCAKLLLSSALELKIESLSYDKLYAVSPNTDALDFDMEGFPFERCFVRQPNRAMAASLSTLSERLNDALETARREGEGK